MAIGEVWSLDAKSFMVGVGVGSAPVQAGQCLQRTIPGEGDSDPQRLSAIDKAG